MHSVPTAPRTASSENVSWGLGDSRMELRGKKQKWKGGPEPGHPPTLQGARLLLSASVLKWEPSEDIPVKEMPPAQNLSCSVS